MRNKNNFKKEILAIIPARGGSKSLPNKNIKPLGGKPLIYYTIRACQESKFITRIIVSTDSKKIAEIAKKFGAEVPFLRPKKLATDLSPVFLTFRHTLLWLQKHERKVPEIVVNLAPTSPLRSAEDIDRGIRLLLAHPQADSVRSVVATPKHPLKMWRLKGERLVPLITHPKLPEAFNLARQLLQKEMPVYVNNGAVDVIRSKTILEKHCLGGKTIYGFIMPAERSINIDSPEDFIIAEYLFKKSLN